MISLSTFQLHRHRYSLSKSIEFVNFINEFRCLVIRSCLLIGQIPCFSVSFLSISLCCWSIYIYIYIYIYIHICDHADVPAKKGAKITQTHIRETFYHSIKQHLKQVFQSAYGRELETNLFQKPRKQEIAKIPDRPRRKAFAEFRLFVGHDCLGRHLDGIAIRPDPYCMLCSLREPMDKNHEGQCAALFDMTECERYWEARAKMMEN